MRFLTAAAFAGALLAPLAAAASAPVPQPAAYVITVWDVTGAVLPGSPASLCSSTTVMASRFVLRPGEASTTYTQRVAVPSLDPLAGSNAAETTTSRNYAVVLASDAGQLQVRVSVAQDDRAASVSRALVPDGAEQIVGTIEANQIDRWFQPNAIGTPGNAVHAYLITVQRVVPSALTVALAR